MVSQINPFQSEIDPTPLVSYDRRERRGILKHNNILQGIALTKKTLLFIFCDKYEEYVNPNESPKFGACP